MSHFALKFSDLEIEDDRLADLLILARIRILGVFRHSTIPETRGRVQYVGARRTPGGVRGAGNAIHGCDNKISDLAWHICKAFAKNGGGGRMLHIKDLPRKVVQSQKEKLLVAALGDLEHRLVSVVLVWMRDNAEIWFECTQGGIWQAEQSAVDEHIRWHALARELKRDDRSFHGRPRSQVKARGIPPGTSIGGSKQGRRMVG